MRLSGAETLTQKFMQGQASSQRKQYGDKFIAFGEQVYQKFDKVIIMKFRLDRQVIQKAHLQICIFASIFTQILQKTKKMPQRASIFMQQCHNKQSDIVTNGLVNPQNAKSFFQWLQKLFKNVQDQLLRLNQDKIYLYIYQLINHICEAKTKQYKLVEDYSVVQIAKLQKVFNQKIMLINYDQDKQCLRHLNLINHETIYILKVKNMYMRLIKSPDIMTISKGTISRQELAAIFKIQSKISQASSIKPSKIETYQDLKQSSQVSTVSKIQNQSLFPRMINCTNCKKHTSQFNSLFWNYSYFCFQCVINPKTDTSSIPSSLIKKFMKNIKYNIIDYTITCPQCQSQTYIKNYKPDDKPKNYNCTICRKMICIQHQQLISQCYCYCFQCDKQTITVPWKFKKFCPGCKRKRCQLCNSMGKQNCQCVCRKCGDSDFPGHQCRQRCHVCRGVNLTLIQNNQKKVCYMCFYTNFDPKAAYA